MSASKADDRNAPILRPSFFGGSGQRHGLAVTSASGVHPIQQSSERSAHEHPPTSANGDNVYSGASVSTTEGNFGRGDHNGELVHSSPISQVSTYIQNETSPSVISNHGLPTYRQASMTDDITPSGHSSPISEFNPYLPDPALPDILYSHIIPRLPPGLPSQRRQERTRYRQDEGHNRGYRHRQRTSADRSSRHRRHSSFTRSTSSSQIPEGTCKEPCVKCMVTITSFRWVLVVLSVIGVCCVVTGIVLASLHAAGQSFLFLAIMFIGLGVLLVIVVGVGWKCTPRGHEPLHALFGIGNFTHGRSRGRRHRRHRNRDRSWVGGMLYPEFQFRRPPPSYAASMQDYQNQTMPEQSESTSPTQSVQNSRVSPPNSPPPSYRSRTSTCHSGILTAFSNINDEDHPSSMPPTYRSRASSHRPSFPHEYRVEIDVPEIEDVVIPFTEESSMQPSLESTSANVVPTSGVTISSASLSVSHLQTAGPPSSEALQDSLSTSISKHPPSSSVASQIQTLTSTRSVQTENQNSTEQARNTLNSVSDFSALVIPSQHQMFTSESNYSERPPSLYQRMDSEDRLILEQTLQSLEDISDDAGIINPAISLGELDTVTNTSNINA